MEDVCRLCARKNDKLIPIYGEEGKKFGLLDKITHYLPIQVSRNNGLPNHCCRQCATDILSWHEMVVNVKAADKLLMDAARDLEAKRVSDVVLAEEENIASNVDRTDNSYDLESLITIVEIPANEGPGKTGKGNLNSRGKKVFLKYMLSDELLKCEDCKLKFLNAQLYAKHIESFHPEIYMCPLCKMSFPNKMDFRQHICSNISKGPDGKVKYYDCKCKKIFVSEDQYKEHVAVCEKMAEPEKYYNCKCKKIFVSEDQYKEHIGKCEIRSDPELYYDCKCKKIFISEDQYKGHVETCEKMTDPEIDSASKHTESVIEESKVNNATEKIKTRKEKLLKRDKWMCDRCGRVVNAANAEKHRKSHLNTEKNCLCNLCPKKFRTMKWLKKHLQTHVKERPFSCDFCSVSFSTKYYLDIHIKIRHKNCIK